MHLVVLSLFMMVEKKISRCVRIGGGVGRCIGKSMRVL